MDGMIGIAEQCKALLNEYGFNRETLARHLSLTEEQIDCLATGDFRNLPQDSETRLKLFNRISFLYASGAEDKDLKLQAFLQVLVSIHHLSKETIARMAGVSGKDVERMLSNPAKPVSEDVKFRIAVTVMALRFFLKDSEREAAPLD